MAALLKNNQFKDALGGWGKLFLLAEGNTLISFITLSARDCISASDCPNSPWLGFFHTAPEYHGKRYGKILVDYACRTTKKDGYTAVYLATDHIGLYEKYGFEYLKNCKDIWGEDRRIYKKTI